MSRLVYGSGGLLGEFLFGEAIPSWSCDRGEGRTVFGKIDIDTTIAWERTGGALGIGGDELIGVWECSEAL